jgi:hypothetical protein
MKSCSGLDLVLVSQMTSGWAPGLSSTGYWPVLLRIHPAFGKVPTIPPICSGCFPKLESKPRHFFFSLLFQLKARLEEMSAWRWSTTIELHGILMQPSWPWHGYACCQQFEGHPCASPKGRQLQYRAAGASSQPWRFRSEHVIPWRSLVLR